MEEAKLGTMYYMLECFPPPDWEDCGGVKTPQQRIVPRGETWSMGRRFSAPPAEPIEFEMMAHHNDRLVELETSDPPLMTKRLLEAFRKSGVDNLDVYQTVITHPTTGFRTTDFVAFNIIGLVAAVDMGSSNVIGGNTEGLLDVDFEGIKVDPNKASGLLMFRLAESTNGIVVHKSVKDSLLAQGFDMLTFMDPDEWLG